MTTGRINQVAIPSKPKPRGSNASGDYATHKHPRGASAPALPSIRLQQVEVPSPASRARPMSRPTPKGEARPSPLRPDHRALTTRDGCRRACGCGEGSGQRARAPLEEVVGRAASRIRLAPKCAPPKRGVAYFCSFGFTGGTSPRPVTASARSHRIPSHSDLNVTPRPPPRFASRRSPGLAGGELRKGPERYRRQWGRPGGA
jgi:hypothetical protein